MHAYLKVFLGMKFLALLISKENNLYRTFLTKHFITYNNKSNKANEMKYRDKFSKFKFHIICSPILAKMWEY